MNQLLKAPGDYVGVGRMFATALQETGFRGDVTPFQLAKMLQWAEYLAQRAATRQTAGQQRRISRAMWVPGEDPQHPTQVYLHYRCAGPLYDKHLQDLAAIAQQAARAHIPLIAFVYNPWLERQTNFTKDPFYTLLNQPVVRALRSYGYSVLDTYPPYQQLLAANNWENLSALWIAPRDAHPNATGHALIAQALFDYIIGTGVLPVPAAG